MRIIDCIDIGSLNGWYKFTLLISVEYNKLDVATKQAK